jgi:hypothetical protein
MNQTKPKPEAWEESKVCTGTKAGIEELNTLIIPIKILQTVWYLVLNAVNHKIIYCTPNRNIIQLKCL